MRVWKREEVNSGVDLDTPGGNWRMVTAIGVGKHLLVGLSGEGKGMIIKFEMSENLKKVG